MKRRAHAESVRRRHSWCGTASSCERPPSELARFEGILLGALADDGVRGRAMCGDGSWKAGGFGSAVRPRVSRCEWRAGWSGLFRVIDDNSDVRKPRAREEVLSASRSLYRSRRRWRTRRRGHHAVFRRREPVTVCKSLSDIPPQPSAAEAPRESSYPPQRLARRHAPAGCCLSSIHPAVAVRLLCQGGEKLPSSRGISFRQGAVSVGRGIRVPHDHAADRACDHVEALAIEACTCLKDAETVLRMLRLPCCAGYVNLLAAHGLAPRATRLSWSPATRARKSL